MRSLLQASTAETAPFPTCSSLETDLKVAREGGIQASYTHNTNCMWIIQTGQDTVTVDFTAFELEMGYDFVRIYDGSTANPNSLLTMLTGKTLPAPVTASSGTMLIVLSSDASVAGTGFALSWTSSAVSQQAVQLSEAVATNTQPCHGNVQLETADGTITDGSSNYANGARCSWAIKSTTGRYITLSFSSLDLEDQYDYVRVYDEYTETINEHHVPTGSGLLLGAFTGRNIPASVTSTTGHMFIVLSSDSSVVSSGFVASYVTSASIPQIGGSVARTPPSTSSSWATPAFNTPFVSAATGACSGTTQLRTNSGNFGSGHALGSNLYGTNADCRWEIQPTVPNALITLTFSTFATEYVYDAVQVYDGATLLGQYSGFNNPGSLTASSGSMTVVFGSDGSVEHGGFSASYVAVEGEMPALTNGYPQPLAPVVQQLPQQPTVINPSIPSACQTLQRLNPPSGSFGTGSAYIDNANCRWLIDAGPGAQVHLQFRRFEMEDFYDWVWVYDGVDENAPLAGKYSGSTLPPNVMATSGRMYIKLTSDSSVHLGGFAAFYSVMSADEANSRRIQPSP
jgi:hypothetical protein